MKSGTCFTVRLTYLALSGIILLDSGVHAKGCGNKTKDKCKGETPDDTEKILDAICKKAFPKVKSVNGDTITGSTCAVTCYGTNEDGYFSILTPKKNGIPCGKGKICLAGNCEKMSNIRLCKQKVKKPIYGIVSRPCQLDCKGAKNVLLYANLPIPANTPCQDVFDTGRTGICNGRGRCCFTKQ